MLYTVPLWFGINYDYIQTPFYEDTVDSRNKTMHYTLVFNTFVWMNLVNQINCRKLGWSDLNVFQHFFNNLAFFVVLGGECAAQWFIVEYGGDAFRTHSLTWAMHICCWSFAVGSLLVGFLGKFIPLEHSSKFALNFNENGADDVLSKMTSQIQKGEKERLLN